MEAEQSQPSYFFEDVQQNTDSNKPIDMDAAKVCHDSRNCIQNII